jgi:hypothetical protein
LEAWRDHLFEVIMEQQALTIFKHEQFGKVRTLLVDGEPWAVAKDIATALGYADTAQAIRKNCKKSKVYEVLSPGRGVQKTTIIPESDIHRLIMRSRLPAAEAFQDWVCEEVLPSIRKTGSYASQHPPIPPTFSDIAPELEGAIRLAKACGLGGNQAILAANKAVLDRYHVDVQKLLGATRLVSATQEKLLTATELARRVDSTRNEINPLLQELGLLSSYRDHRKKIQWELTDEGKLYGVYLDVGKARSNGTPIQQIKWNANVVDWIDNGENAEIDLDSWDN